MQILGCYLGVFLRFLFKRGFAAQGTKIIGFAFVFRFPLCGSRVNFHFANRIYFHGLLSYKNVARVYLMIGMQ